MVSAPVREGEGRFALDLVVDAGTETMQDHITGQHVPAIALLEAARQAWTAVTEEHLLTNGDGATRFVIVSVHAEFGRYVFPLPARLRYELIDHRRDALGEAFRCRIAVVQGGAEATVVEAEYRVVPETISDKQESMAARRALTEVDVRPASPVPATNG